MKKAPAGGFAKGATCDSTPQSYEGDSDLVLGEGDGAGDDGALALSDALQNELSDGFADTSDDAFGEDSAMADRGLAADATETHAHAVDVDVPENDACGSCFYAICEADSYCCDTEWDDRCVATGMTICASLCGEDATQPL